MDESTFETFEEELGTPLQETPQPKPVRQSRRPEPYPQRRVREEPPVVQQVPKSVPREAPGSRGMSLRKALSVQNLAQIEPPWQGVTLNRCIFIAITILVLTSGCQRLNEFLRGRKDAVAIDAVGTALNVKHAALRKGQLIAPEPETSLWDTVFWWVSDDDDDDDDDEDVNDEESKQGKSRKVTPRATRSLRHKAIPDRKLLKEKGSQLKGRRGKARQDEEEARVRAKAQREKVKNLKEKRKEEQKEERKIKDNKKKASKKVKGNI